MPQGPFGVDCSATAFGGAGFLAADLALAAAGGWTVCACAEWTRAEGKQQRGKADHENSGGIGGNGEKASGYERSLRIDKS
jgi:hypothetical protein